MGLFKKDLTTSMLNVEGMKCPHCQKKVEETLKNNKVKASVSLQEKTVEVKYDEKKITLSKIKAIINELGFDCK